MNNYINVECPGLDKLSLSQVNKFNRTLFAAITKADGFLIDSLDDDFEISHDLDVKSTYAKPKVNYNLRGPEDLDAEKNAALINYLNKGRHSIFSADYQGAEWDNELLRNLTETAIEAENLVLSQKKLFETKILNRVALSKAIEKVTSIECVGTSGLGISILAENYQTNINALTKRKAEDLLGGKWIDKETQTWEFTVSRINFESVQKRCEFLLDGCPVPVFITDMDWIKDFNAGRIKLAKGDRVKATVLIERSPISKKAVAYYFIEVYGPNLEGC